MVETFGAGLAPGRLRPESESVASSVLDPPIARRSICKSVLDVLCIEGGSAHCLESGKNRETKPSALDLLHWLCRILAVLGVLVPCLQPASGLPWSARPRVPDTARRSHSQSRQGPEAGTEGLNSKGYCLGQQGRSLP